MTLSRDLSTIKPSYDVIVIGSGYGGAITAARLAQAGRQVCVLERGKEWDVGTFPDDVDEVVGELRCDDKPLGLYDFHPGEDLDVLVGNGLGGTSLINANVVIAPDDDVFQRARWPLAIREAAKRGELEKYGKRFEDTLGAAFVPEEHWPAKVRAMRLSAEHSHGTFRPVKVAIHFEAESVDDAGVRHHACTLCGDCVTGCNVGAKNTLAMNYLPIAVHAGAEIFTGAEVDHVVAAPGGGTFVVYRDVLAPGTALCEPLFAPVVVVAAGSLGSTGILLRSAQRGLALSYRLGHHFSGNADQLGFGYNGEVRTDVLGFGHHQDKRSRISVGPTIASLIEFGTGEGRFIIEDGAVPRAFVDAMRHFGPILAGLDGRDTDGGIRDELGELGRGALDWLGYDENGAANHSMVYLGMGHDGADGRLVLDPHGKVKVMWSEVEDRPVFGAISAEMHSCVEALGGTFVRNPRWNELLGRNLVTVHPLGGCPMGDDAESGVVNAFGEVFDPSGGVHAGLFVADGAVIPSSIGVNPLRTIATLAERTAEHIAGRVDLQLPLRRPVVPRVVAPPLGLQFSEEMKGFVAPATQDAADRAGYQAAYHAGRDTGTTVAFNLTMFVEDLDRFIVDPAHEARAEGCVDSKLFGAGRRVDRGRFNLFIEDAGTGVKRMRYLLRFLDRDNQVHLLDGYKLVEDDPGLDLWADNTTLFTRIRKGASETDPIVAIGILRIGVPAFVKLLSTVRIRNGVSASASARALSRFGRFFLGDLWETYVTPKLAAR